MPVTLYGTDLSPPVRAAKLALKALGVDYEYKVVDLLAGDHLKPEFIKINPQHTVPTVVDDDFAVWDSHVIATYFAEKTGNDSWYPKDLKKRAIVNQRLHFDNALLFTRLRDAIAPLVLGTASAVEPERIKRLEEALELLEPLVHETGGWLAGDKPTLADCCAAATVSSIVAAFPSIKVPERVAAWLKRCEQNLPGYLELNKAGADGIGEFLASRMKK